MKISVVTVTPSGLAYLSHRGKVSFSPSTARKYLAEYRAANPSHRAWTENEFREATPSANRLEARARRLYALRLIDPRAPQYALAAVLMETAKAIRQFSPIINPQ